MDLTLAVICDKLREKHPSLSVQSRQTREKLTGGCDELIIVGAEELAAHSRGYKDKVLFVIGDKAAETDTQALVSINEPGLTAQQLRGELFNIKARLDRWNERLLCAIADEEQLADFLRLAAEAFPCPIFVENVYGQIMAEVGVGFVRPEGFVSKPGRTSFQIHHKFSWFARLNLLEDEKNITEGCVFLARHLVGVLEEYFSVMQAKGVEFNDSASVLSRLSAGIAVEREIVQYQLSKHGWGIYDSYYVMTADFFGREQASTDYLNSLSNELRCNLPSLLFFQSNGQLFIIANQKKVQLNEALLVTLVEFTKKHGLHMGLSSCFCDFMQLEKHCKEALYALFQAGKAGDGGCVIPYEQVRNQFLKEYLLAANSEYGDIIHPDVELLESLDPSGEQQSVTTLYFYLLSGANVSAAARRLFIDRNTLLYRLGKISAVLGTDIVKVVPEDTLRLHYLISCYIVMHRNK